MKKKPAQTMKSCDCDIICHGSCHRTGSCQCAKTPKDKYGLHPDWEKPDQPKEK